jgi:transcriptional regulator with PAS, ATPase and Fis domain
MGIAKMIDNLNTAVVACDADLKFTYANSKFKQMSKKLISNEDIVGKQMADCHKAETMDKIKKLVQEYKGKRRNLDYYTIDGPDGKITIVNVPIYEDNKFAGIMEFFFESSLA